MLNNVKYLHGQMALTTGCPRDNLNRTRLSWLKFTITAR
jgi:hypothetical protein